MKKTIICMAMLAASATAAMADDNGHAGATDGYQLVWSDEFNGNALDETLWNIEVNGNGGGNQELQYYRRENISIENAPVDNARCLVLTARKEDYQGKKFTSGRLNGQGKVYFKHGKVESRILMPKTANGLWPAFWMMGNDITKNSWPRCGEIDIVEMGNGAGISRGTQDRYFNGACHWGFYNEKGQYPNYANAVTYDYSIQDGQFHLFTCIWDENSIRMYVDLDKYPDAKPYYEIGIKGSDIDSEWSTGLYFHKNFYILYDLAVGGTFTGITGNNNADRITALADGEKKMYIDWVRVYQKDDLNINYPNHPGTASDENDYKWETTPEEDPNIPAAPNPTKAETEVYSLFSDVYTNNHNFDYAEWWGGQAEKSDYATGGNNMWRIKKFVFIGSEHDQADFSSYEGLHMDIYPVTKELQMGVFPINKNAAGTDNEDERGKNITLVAGQWNQVNIPISDFTSQGLSMQRTYQLKLTNLVNGGANEFFIDNIYYYRGGAPVSGISHLSEVRGREGAGARDMYNLAGQRVSDGYKGIVIRNGKKMIIR
ncbi:MAG: glycoside hydrolase family 16 protein [Prevotella sp.]|nr:glycoside hydrolase family 16 protein [Prevotella sp.]